MTGLFGKSKSLKFCEERSPKGSWVKRRAVLWILFVLTFCVDTVHQKVTGVIKFEKWTENRSEMDRNGIE